MRECCPVFPPRIACSPISGLDPAPNGCQSYGATDFLIRRRRASPEVALILWQIGGIGETGWNRAQPYRVEALRVLREELIRLYHSDHPVTIYQAAALPGLPPMTETVPLRHLDKARIGALSTLFVPPACEAARDPQMLRRLGLPIPA